MGFSFSRNINICVNFRQLVLCLTDFQNVVGDQFKNGEVLEIDALIREKNVQPM